MENANLESKRILSEHNNKKYKIGNLPEGVKLKDIKL